jgi:hypothetical protein
MRIGSKTNNHRLLIQLADEIHHMCDQQQHHEFDYKRQVRVVFQRQPLVETLVFQAPLCIPYQEQHLFILVAFDVASDLCNKIIFFDTIFFFF